MLPSVAMDADSLISELGSVAERDAAAGLPARGPATTERRHALKSLSYSHEAMINVLVENPWIQQNQLAVLFGRTPAWISTILQTDAFKAQLAKRQEEIIDPEMRASAKERFEAILHQSMRVLQEKLSKPAGEVPDNLALRAIELGAKGLGMGGFAATVQQPPQAPAANHLETLASRLLELQSTVRKANAQDAVIVAEVPK